MAPLETRPPAPPVAPHEVEVFYDGDCPLCRREIDWIRRRDRHERIRFTDITADGFNADDYGSTMPELMAEIHGRDAEGRWLTGVEVFRRLYQAIGFGPIVSMTRWFGLRQALDLGYRLFAKQRLRLTGRCEADACQVGRPPEKRAPHG